MKLSVCLLAALLLCVKAPALLAQPARTANTQIAGMSWHAISLQNVAPRFVAYWLDPANNPRPSELAAGAESLEPDAENTALLPPGDDVAAIKAADAQKTLLVLATPVGLARVQAWVDKLDQPTRFFEIEAQWVKITPEAATQLGFALDDPTKLRTQAASRDARKKLDALIAQNKAELLAESYFVAANNLEERRVITASAPLEKWSAAQKGGAEISLNAATTLEVTPSSGNDNAIGLRVKTARQLLLLSPDAERDAGAIMRQLTQPRPPRETPLPAVVQSGVAQLFLLETRSGDTNALTGFPPDWFVGPGQIAAQNGDLTPNVVLLLTVRVVPLAGK